ncbi:MAG: hypothetical protein HN576_07895 [Bacteriovoracaceae bacterium]|jgi:hypothetical protein|nr:hypothetical protein [Bacteriovoracaceae bacterium]
MAEITQMNIILLEHRLDYKAIYGMNLTLYLGANVITTKTIQETMNIISEQNIDLIFINNDAYVQDIANDLFTKMEKNLTTVPLFIIGNTKLNNDLGEKFESNCQLRDVIQSIAKSKSITAKMMSEMDQPAYFPLPMEFIVPGWQTIVEIFIKRSDTYRIAFLAEEIIFSEQLEEQKADGNNQLYVDRDKRLRFVNNITLQMTAKLNDPNMELTERVKVTEVAFQMVMEQARQIGIGDSTMELANSCIESMTSMVKSIPSLDKLLKNILKNTGSYRYKQSLLISYIGSHIIKKTKYPSKTQQEIFAFVSFFHNIGLHKDEYAMIHTDEQLEESNLSEKEKILIERHAIIAARLVTNSGKKNPYEVGIILKQHHGSTKGLGLSNLSPNISHLAMIFIFAQEWTNIVLNFENEERRPNKKQVIETLKRKYDLKGFYNLLPILDTLEL